MDRFLDNIENEHINAAAGSFGSAALDVYFLGKTFTGAVSGVRGFNRAARLLRLQRSPTPYRSALWCAMREAASFRGIGLYKGNGVLGTRYNLPVNPKTGAVRVIRFVGGQNAPENDLIAKALRETETALADPQGNPRPLPEILRAHIANSSGSPLQSAYPYGDAQTMLVANPDGMAAIKNSPYYVVIEIPADKALIDVNRAVLASNGGRPGAFPEFSTNRYGLLLPEELRPANSDMLRPGRGELYSHLPPELRAWARANAGVSNPAGEFLEGIAYGEWEQTILAPDLRPYVVEIRPNPVFEGARPDFIIRKPTASIYHPTLNPEALWDFGSRSAANAARVRDYLNWLAASSSHTPLTPEQIAAGANLTYLGGKAPGLPLLTFGDDAGAPAPPKPVTERDIQDYTTWINDGTGQAMPRDLVELIAGGSSAAQRCAPLAMTRAADDISQAAAKLAEAGYKVTELRAGPGLIAIEVHAPSAKETAAIVRKIVDNWSPYHPGMELGITVVAPGASGAELLDARNLGFDLPPDASFAVTSE
jgi:hypothetical protein